ncbi:MAG: choice-of-anchor D domain-containing protein, partial [Deltaproteobacteria bacterium]|nr:choice-of-anchor D domain-containing protein [Deltaproteobacteria bacterium]
MKKCKFLTLAWSGKVMSVAYPLFAIGIVLLSLSCGDTPVESKSCSRDTDCRPNEHCVENTCVPKGNEFAVDSEIPPDALVEHDGNNGDADSSQDSDSKTERIEGNDSSDRPDYPVLATDPPSLDFGEPMIGDAVSRELVLHNVGGRLLVISRIGFEPGTSDEFSAQPQGDLDMEIDPKDTGTVTVTFQARDPGAETGNLTIESNDKFNHVTKVPLITSQSGKSELAVVGDPAEALVEVKELDFGQVSVGASGVKDVYIKNLGSGNSVLTVSKVEVTGDGKDLFTVKPVIPPSVYLNPFDAACPNGKGDCVLGETCSNGVCIDASGKIRDLLRLEIGFSPDTGGAVQGTLVIENDEQDNALDGDERNYRIALKGSGLLPELSVLPNPVDFGTVYVGKTKEL